MLYTDAESEKRRPERSHGLGPESAMTIKKVNCKHVLLSADRRRYQQYRQSEIVIKNGKLLNAVINSKVK
jgi:hypothetical protein